MLRVIFVTCSLTHGGAERHAVTLMNRLGERGHECHAVYLKNESPSQIDRVRLRDGGTVHCLNATRYFDVRSLADFAAHISRIGPSVIVAANPYPLMYSSLAMRIARWRAPLLVTYHSTRLLGAKEQLQMLLYRLFFWAADRSVFVSEKQKRYSLRRGILARGNEVIHNGVDTNWFCDRWSADEHREIRAALGYSAADYVIGIAAWLRPEKNHVQLVDAVAALRHRGIPARALMIGDGETRAAIEARARALKVENHVEITGFQPEVRPYIAACDVVALCSVTEAFSIAAIEAMALRRPVVHSDVGGASEMIFPGWNGYLFPVGDTQALVDRLAILADRGVAERMGERARLAAATLFSEDKMIDRYEQTLLELCRKRPGVAEAVRFKMRDA